MDDQLSQRLERVRLQLSSKLENQSSVAKTLVAVEDVLREQEINASATAYLVTLLSLLASSVSPDEAQVNYQLAAPVLYLLDLVLPSVPPHTLRTYYLRTIPTLVAVLDAANSAHTEGSAAVARSIIGAIETLLLAQDFTAWKSRDEMSVLGVFTGYIMGSGTDSRPKVRKRALDAVKTILDTVPANPTALHPAAEESAMIAFHIVEGQFGSKKGRAKGGSEKEVKAVHSLHLLKMVASAVSWPKIKIRELVELLLKLSSEAYDDNVRLSALEVFQVIFAQASEGMDASHLKEVLEIISSHKPEKKDSQLLPSWLAIIAAGYNAYAELDADACLHTIVPLLRQIFTFLQSESPSVREAVGSTLVVLSEHCLSSEDAAPEIADETLQAVAEIAMLGLTTRYQLAWREVFRFLGALFLALRERANPLFLDAIKVVDGMRATEGFEGKAEAEAVIGAAVTGVGPEAVLKVLPLNLENERSQYPGRAWLLPILKASIKNTRLGHFSNYFVPLSERLYQRVLAGENNKGKTMENKILETVVEQMWALLPSYCDVPTDLVQAFNQPFAELLANVVYQQVNLRAVVCRALTNLIEKNSQLLQMDLDDTEMMQKYRLTEGEVQQNCNLMASFATNFLSILFNVFSQTTPSYRSPISECIKAFLSVASQEEIRETLQKVGELLKQNLSQAPTEKSELPTLAQTTVDLLLIMIPYLPVDTYESLWTELAPLLKSKDDGNMQRRAYRCLAKLTEIESGQEFLVNRLDQVTEIVKTSDTHASAQKDRILALDQIVQILPPQSLHVIPNILPEAVLATKEKNDKARDAAYSLLITMGKKMQAGGTVKNAMVDGMDEDSADATASIREYFLMVSAGLAGSSQHMISATITALSRMLYEFKDDLSADLVDDLISTMEVFLTSKSREIARSAIGFIKVALVSIPKEVLEKILDKLIPNLMVWSHEARGHFRIKVKTLMERMMRKFGYDTLVKYTPEEDHKLLINIRKTRDRKKRGRLEAMEAEEEEIAKPTTVQSEYDAILNESDSDLDFSDLEKELNKAKSKKYRRQQPETYIREGSEEPVDLLSQNAFSKVTTQKPLSRAEQNHRAAKSASRASTFKSNRQNRMIFEDPQNSLNGKSQEGKVEYNAYEEAHESRDMAKRGFRDKVKFSNKRRRQDAEGFEGDVEMTDAYAEQKAPPTKKKTVKFDGRRKNGAFQYRKPI